MPVKQTAGWHDGLARRRRRAQTRRDHPADTPRVAAGMSEGAQPSQRARACALAPAAPTPDRPMGSD